LLPIQRPRRKRAIPRKRVKRGSAKTSAAASTPATAITIKPACNHPPTFATPIATPASGLSAALSSRPSRKSERATAPKLTRERLQRRTTATRSTSSKRPGSAMPPTEAAPPAAASVSTAGRSSLRKSRCQPHAFVRYAPSMTKPASATSQKFAWCSGQPASAKWRATSPATTTAASTNRTLRRRFREGNYRSIGRCALTLYPSRRPVEEGAGPKCLRAPS